MRTSWQMLKQMRRALAVALLFGACINVLMLAAPLYVLHLLRPVLPAGGPETLLTLTLMAAGAVLAAALIEMARDTVLLRAALWLDHELGAHTLQNGLALAQPEGELRSARRALTELRGCLTGTGFGALLDAPWSPIFLLILAYLDPTLGIAAAAGAGLLLMMALLNGLASARAETECQKAAERSGEAWRADARDGRIAGALGLTPGLARQWERANRAYVAAAYVLGRRALLARGYARLVRHTAELAVYTVGAVAVLRGALEPGVVVVAVILVARALAPLEQLVPAMRAARVALAAVRRLKALPADAVLPIAGNGDVAGHVVLTDVTVRHANRRTAALEGISLRLSPGACLGIVGPGGSGKSTLAAVLAGAVVPASGTADLDGIAIAKWQRCDGAPPIGYLPDEPLLLEGSVHDSITRFSGDGVAAAAEAAMRAGVHETLAGLVDGYETTIGPGGRGLSRRERRAVALARALHGAPRVLVLDEPELGLDAADVRRLVSALAALKSAGVGLVIVTQDSRLLALTDTVLMLDGGRMRSLEATAEPVRPAVGWGAPPQVVHHGGLPSRPAAGTASTWR